jgi:uncharacterized membrane protein
MSPNYWGYVGDAMDNLVSDYSEVKDTARIDAFSDGVFAIVITLLIFNLRVPSPAEADQVGLWTLLMRDWVSYLALVTSFAIIGIMWVNHHRMFQLVRKVDNTLKYVNLLLLFGVTIVPFVTNLAEQYVGHRDAWLAGLIYGISALLIAFWYTLFLIHLGRHPELLASGYSVAHVKTLSSAYRWGPPGYITAILLSFVSVPLSLVIHLALAIYFALPIRHRA